MYLSKSQVFGLILGVFLFAASPTFINAQTIVDIQAQIQQLLARIAMLQQQLSQQQTGQQATGATTSSDTRGTSDSATNMSDAPDAPYVRGEVLVTFKSPSGGGDAMLDEQTLNRKTQAVEDSFRVHATGEIITGKTVLFKTANNESTRNLINRMGRDASIESVQPNYIYKLQAQEVPWGVGAGQGINAPAAWQSRGLPNFTRGVNGEGVVVAVVDSGVDYNNEDLAQNIWTNPNEDCSNGRDDDGNGLVDDCRGWDFVNHDNDPIDDNGHGTHVSGTIAARDNSVGVVVGVAPKAKIMPVKVSDSNGSVTTAAISMGIGYASSEGAKVINLSFNGIIFRDSVMETAVNRAVASGVTIVAAAGNNGGRVTSYPAAYDNVISVGAVDSTRTRASFSNIGDWLDVVAPGVGIKSTLPNNSYASWDGTSMAAPHVAGAVALFLQRYPTATPSQVREALHRYAIDLGDSGRDDYYGDGFVDAYALVSGALPIISTTTTGTIRIRATLDGNPVTTAAPIVFDYASPAGVLTRNISSDTQHNYLNMPVGIHQVAYMKVNMPAGVTFKAVTPSARQKLTAGGEITFTFAFISQSDGTGTAGDARTVFGVANTNIGRADSNSTNTTATNSFRRFNGTITDGVGGTIYEPTHDGLLINTYDDMRQPWLACEVLGYSPVGNTYAREHAGWILELPTFTVIDVDANGNNIYRERVAYRHNGVWRTIQATLNGGKGAQFGTYTTRNGTYDAWEGLQVIKRLVCYGEGTTIPAAPTGLIFQSRGAVGPNATWDSVPGATYYQLRIDNTAANPWNGTCNGNLDSGNFCQNIEHSEALNGVGRVGVGMSYRAGAQYKWWVHACNASGCSAPSHGNNFTEVAGASTNPGVTTGTVHIRATLNGNAATADGQAVIDYLAPAGNAVDYALTVPSDFPNVPVGTYTVKYKSATLPSGVSFKGINGTYRSMVDQTLTTGGDITFTLDFIGTSAAPTNAPSYTHYTTGAWSECSGYNPATGAGGNQTRSVTSRTDTTPPNESAPASSQSCSVTIATGTVRISATYNGASVSTPLPVVIDYWAPGGNATDYALTLPSDFPNVPVGTYTVKYKSVTLPVGAVSGISFKGISGTFLGQVSQTLTAGGTITFTLDFVGPTAVGDSAHKMANALEAVRAAFKGVWKVFQP